ncbi:MAG: hypothetical protein MJA83_14180 [Gammaproteobacteria bacterium]|nr:hypothetical protein [Gammaproteobacteria bacterium]
MKYTEIDRTLNSFARSTGLQVKKIYKDEEIRSFDVIDDQATRYQIWLEIPENQQTISVCAWDLKKNRIEYTATKANLGEQLEAAYQAVEGWIKAKGHTRTPVL